MKLILDPNKNFYLEGAHEFENVILSDDAGVRPATIKNDFIHRCIFKTFDVVTGPRIIARPGAEDYIAVLMGMRTPRCLPWFIKARSRHMYLFDAWPHDHGKIADFIRKYEVDNLFFSSLQCADIFRRKKLSCRFHHVPEGIIPEKYSYRPYEEKDIDVLSIGRQYQSYNDRVAAPLEQAGRVFMRPVGKEYIFPTQSDLCDGFARSRIAVCVPRAISHPGTSADISTLTQRYLEAMVSKCLIVGITPYDMDKVFGYSPVVEIDNSAPAEQLLDILNNYSNYIPLIEKNYTEVTTKHTWKQRWEVMKPHLPLSS